MGSEECLQLVTSVPIRGVRRFIAGIALVNVNVTEDDVYTDSAAVRKRNSFETESQQLGCSKTLSRTILIVANESSTEFWGIVQYSMCNS